MGDLGAVDGNGVVLEDRFAIRNPDPSTISKDYWVVAEEVVQEVVNCIHPTLDSEERRNNVIDYVQTVLKSSLGFEVFPFGSVPLKTYLPDGDIDLTILNNPCVEEFWATEVLSVLHGEEQNENAEYEVKDTQFIDAEICPQPLNYPENMDSKYTHFYTHKVKLVKCLVQNIIIDISFNQSGGICTLCFLEQVDRLVGKNHLFKRSIILIKAWCYYESRILGSYHGLLSTYAVETLVLYIFQLFHSFLDGPLAVLYKFLDYFSIFDWENYCISINGPVCKSSLPDIVVEMPENHGNNLMLSEEFLRNCVEMFAVQSRDSGSNPRTFPLKHLNIIDPLKEHNNLGRSVHRGNFYRIRSAFKYGARKLRRIMSLPIQETADEIKKFFSNTLQRHLYKNGCDTEVYSSFSLEGSRTLCSLLSSEGFSEDDIHMKSYTGDLENEGLETDERCSSVESGRSLRQLSSHMTSELAYSANGMAVSGTCSNGYSCDLAACSSLDFRGLNGTSDCSSSSNLNNSFSGQYYHAPQFCSYEPPAEYDFYQFEPSDGLEGRLDLNPWLECTENHSYGVDTYQSCADNLDSNGSCSSVSSLNSSILESLSLDFRERDADSLVDLEPSNPLVDLTGEYDSHIRSLSYWKCCQGLVPSAPVYSVTSALPSQFPRMKACSTFNQSGSSRPSSWFVMNSSTVFMEVPASVSAPASVFASEGNSKTRGMGMHLPTMNLSSRDKPSLGRTRNTGPVSHVQVQRETHSSGNVPCFVDKSSSAKTSPRDALNAQIPFQARKKSGVNHSKEGDAPANVSLPHSSFRIEFGSLGRLADEVISCSAYSSSKAADKCKLTSGSITKKDRDADRLFHLKNDEEFPALPVHTF